MIRNFVAGVLWGSVVAGLGLAVISQITPMPDEIASTGMDAPMAAAVPEVGGAMPLDPVVSGAEVAEGVDAVTSATAPGAVATAEDTATLDVAAPDVVAPIAPNPPAPVTAEAPATEPADTAAAAQAPVADSPDAISSPAETPAAELPQSDLPAAAAPSALAEAPAAPAASAVADGAPAVIASDSMAKANPTPGFLPAAPGAEQAPPMAELPPRPVAQADEALLNPVMPPVKDPAPAVIILDPAATPDTKQPGLLADQGAETLAPTKALPATVEGVTTGRLPQIGGAEPAVTAPLPDDAPPIQRFARPFQNDSGKPLFAVILRDTGAADLDRAKLAALPFPVTFVVDPLADTATEAARIYRAAGQEVLMLASGIPLGAQAADLEQTFQAHAAVLPDAVAVIDLASGGFQDNRPLATLVVPLIKAQGRGLITYDMGLNAADQVARREDVPSAAIFRQLDAEDEDVPVIRRYLDRAAFKAAQEGRVVVLGQTRPETIAALMEWTLEGRASSVTLAPATAVMTVQ